MSVIFLIFFVFHFLVFLFPGPRVLVIWYINAYICGDVIEIKKKLGMKNEDSLVNKQQSRAREEEEKSKSQKSFEIFKVFLLFFIKIEGKTLTFESILVRRHDSYPRAPLLPE